MLTMSILQHYNNDINIYVIQIRKFIWIATMYGSLAYNMMSYSRQPMLECCIRVKLHSAAKQASTAMVHLSLIVTLYDPIYFTVGTNNCCSKLHILHDIPLMLNRSA